MLYLKRIAWCVCILLCMQQVTNAQTIMQQAMEKARNEKKLILLNFSGSDWCIPCIQMHTEYLQGEAFNKLLAERIVYINADFPRKKKNIPSADIVKQNELLAEKFNPDGAFPFTLLLNEDGKILKKWDGKPSEKPAAFIQTIVDEHKQSQ